MFDRTRPLPKRGHVTASNPAAGKPVAAADLVNVPRLVTAYFAGKPDPADRHPARRLRHLGPSRHVAEKLVQRKPYPGDDAGDLRSPPRNRPDRSAVRRHRYPCAGGTGARERDRGVRRQRRRDHDRRARRLHADACHLARDPELQQGHERPALPMASSSRRRTIRRRTAATNITRRMAARPIPTSPARSRRPPTPIWKPA